MNESFLKIPQAEVEKLCLEALDRIKQSKAKDWDRLIDHLNFRRSQRWFSDRKPLTRKEGKDYFRNRNHCGPELWYFAEEQRIPKLLKAARHPTPDGIMYVSRATRSVWSSGLRTGKTRFLQLHRHQPRPHSRRDQPMKRPLIEAILQTPDPVVDRGRRSTQLLAYLRDTHVPGEQAEKLAVLFGEI